MPDEPGSLVDAVVNAEAAFGGQLGRLDYEAHLDPDSHDPNVVQLRKACRVLDAASSLRTQGGDYTVGIENSFIAIEGSIHF